MIAKCRICNQKLKKIINYGKQALVGNFIKAKKDLKKDQKFSLTLNYCTGCAHIQIKEFINPKILFTNYLWETGVSKTNILIINNLLKDLKKKFKLDIKSKVFEIASNDGSLLKIFKKKVGCYVCGVDPARNFIKLYKNNKIKYYCNFFNLRKSQKILKEQNKFDFIVARNVIAHVSNPNEIFKGAHNLLSDKGIFLVEFPSVLDIYRGIQYDNVFHEHVGYHSLKSINDLAKKNGLELIDIDTIESQGTSLRCFLRKSNPEKLEKKNTKVLNYLKLEKKNKIFTYSAWQKFSSEIKRHSKKLKKTLQILKNKKKNISAYGASGKGMSLLQYSKIGTKLIDNIYDMSRLKINKYTPGTHIKILHPRKIQNSKINYMLLISWNLQKEIIQQNKKFTRMGGKFIIPFPKIKIIK
jgi:SAM-dependent methyltransferase